MRTSKFITATAFISAVMLLSAGFAVAGPPEGPGGPNADGPKKVWICHFEDHEAGAVWATVGGEGLDGDYVVNYAVGMPLPNQVQYCETGETGSPTPGNLLLVSVNAVSGDHGHRVQLQDRINDYPDGYKG